MPFPNPDTQFKPGNPGGPGRPRTRALTDALAALIAEEGAARALAAVWLRKALRGDPRYFQMLLDRLEGKVVQPVAVEDGGGVKELLWPDAHTDGQDAAPAPGAAGGADVAGPV